MNKDQKSLDEERKKIIDFYNDQLQLLSSQKAHDQLRLDIEEIALKRLMVKQKIAEIKAPDPKDDNKNFNTDTDGNSKSGQESC